MVKFTVAINNDNLEKLLSFIFKELGLHSGQAKKLLGDAHALVDCVEWPNFVNKSLPTEQLTSILEISGLPGLSPNDDGIVFVPE